MYKKPTQRPEDSRYTEVAKIIIIRYVTPYRLVELHHYTFVISSQHYDGYTSTRLNGVTATFSHALTSNKQFQFSHSSASNHINTKCRFLVTLSSIVSFPLVHYIKLGQHNFRLLHRQLLCPLIMSMKTERAQRKDFQTTSADQLQNNGRTKSYDFRNF